MAYSCAFNLSLKCSCISYLSAVKKIQMLFNCLYEFFTGMSEYFAMCNVLHLEHILSSNSLGLKSFSNSFS